MRRIIIIAVCCMALSACTDPEAAREALEGAGYTDVVTRDAGWFENACSDGDTTNTPFTATGPTGHTVESAVCGSGGWGKGSTIRITKTVRKGARS